MFRAGVLLVVCGVSTVAGAFGETYQITRLGGAPDARFRPDAITENGVIVGRLNAGDAWQQAAVIRDGQLSVLDQPISWARGINAAGHVAGTFRFSALDDHACVWGPARLDLGTLPGGRESHARAINDAGVIVGESWWHPDGTNRAVRWEVTPHGVNIVDLHVGGRYSYTRSISNDGVIVGAATTDDQPFTPQPARWVNDQAQRLGTLGGVGGAGVRINDAGRVVGWAETGEYVSGHAISRAVVWDGATPTDLGTLSDDPRSAALGLNEVGDIVGWSGYAEGDGGDGGTIFRRAVLWRDLGMIDLNEEIPADSGWELFKATDTTNDGRIIGYGRHDGLIEGFLLTPIPEPSVAALFMSGALLFYRRRTGQLPGRRNAREQRRKSGH